jgi:hypothetical protein
MKRNVGYYGVLMAALWMQSASADVIVVEASGSSQYSFSASCPSGYVIVSVHQIPQVGNWVQLNSTTNPTSAYSQATGDLQATTFKLMCAKVCN